MLSSEPLEPLVRQSASDGLSLASVQEEIGGSGAGVSSSPLGGSRFRLHRRCGSPALATRRSRLAQEGRRLCHEAANGSYKDAEPESPRWAETVNASPEGQAVPGKLESAPSDERLPPNNSSSPSPADDDDEPSSRGRPIKERPAAPSMVRAHRHAAGRAMALLQAAAAPIPRGGSNNNNNGNDSVPEQSVSREPVSPKLALGRFHNSNNSQNGSLQTGAASASRRSNNSPSTAEADEAATRVSTPQSFSRPKAFSLGSASAPQRVPPSGTALQPSSSDTGPSTAAPPQTAPGLVIPQGHEAFWRHAPSIGIRALASSSVQEAPVLVPTQPPPRTAPTKPSRRRSALSSRAAEDNTKLQSVKPALSLTPAQRSLLVPPPQDVQGRSNSPKPALETPSTQALGSGGTLPARPTARSSSKRSNIPDPRLVATSCSPQAEATHEVDVAEEVSPPLPSRFEFVRRRGRSPTPPKRDASKGGSWRADDYQAPAAVIRTRKKGSAPKEKIYSLPFALLEEDPRFGHIWNVLETASAEFLAGQRPLHDPGGLWPH